MCPTYPCFSTAARPLGLSYPASRQRFCSPSSGAGRSTTTASSVSSSSLQSGTLAPAITAPSGPPSASTSTLFLVPFLPRSVGFLPVFSPPNRDLPSIPSALCHFQSTAPSSSHSSASTVQTRSKTPFLHHRWNQRWIELSSPNCLGSLFHWHPLRSRKMMPLKAARQSIRLRPPCSLGGGGASSVRIGSILCQRRSGTSQMVSSGLISRFVRAKAASPEVRILYLKVRRRLVLGSEIVS